LTNSLDFDSCKDNNHLLYPFLSSQSTPYHSLNLLLMKKLVFVSIAFLSVFAISCTKDDADPVPVVKSDYYQLKVGNYWVYQGMNIDTNGVATPTAMVDSAFIEKDTLIRGYSSHPAQYGKLPGAIQL
jgi:hypothetical protein